eukprot:1134246-Pelagomonas_calceolata.AAC.4
MLMSMLNSGPAKHAVSAVLAWPRCRCEWNSQLRSDIGAMTGANSPLLPASVPLMPAHYPAHAWGVRVVGLRGRPGLRSAASHAFAQALLGTSFPLLSASPPAASQ